MRTRYTLINMAVNIGGQLLNQVLGFIGRMVFIHYLSAAYLGVNGLFTDVLGMLNLAELGIGTAMIFSLYEPAAKDDKRKLAQLMNLYKILYRVVAVIVLLVGLALMPFLGFFIKDSGKLIGLLCINFDDSRYRAISDHILKLCHPDLFVTDVLAQPLPENEDGVSARSSPEKFRNSADAVALDAINRELERMGVTPGHLTHSERLQVITSLESAGIFLLKGAIKSAAAALGCSTASIYRYLSQINPSD